MADRDMHLNLVWNTLMFFAHPDSYTVGERTGGVLQGCPRNPPLTPDQMAGYARRALAELREYVGVAAPDPWMLDGDALPTCKCGQPWVLNTVHRAYTPCYLAADPADGLGVGVSGDETFRAEYTREELGKGVRGKYRDIDWGEVDEELSDILIMCSGDQRVVLLPKLRELLQRGRPEIDWGEVDMELRTIVYSQTNCHIPEKAWGDLRALLRKVSGQ